MSKRIPLVYMVSPMALICKRYAAGCTKNSPKILRPQNSEKEKNAPGLGRKRQNRVRFGCWRGCGRLRTGGNGWENPVSEPKRTPFPYNTCKTKTGENPVFSPVLWQGQKDLVSPAASSSAPRWGAPSTDRGGSRDRRSRAPLALAHPSARGFGVDVEIQLQERGRGGGARFSQTSPETAVLIWCCEEILRGKDGKNKFFLRTVVLSNPQ